MELIRSVRFERSYAKAPEQVQRAFDKQSLLLLHNLHHPSLRARKYDEGRNLWQARVNQELAVLLPGSGRCLLHRGYHSTSEVTNAARKRRQAARG